MKSKILLASLIIISLIGVAELSALAKSSNDIPKGLEDKGPLTKITFIHYKDGQARPAGAGKTKTVQCYGFLANGAKWKTIESYYINPSGPGLSSSFVKSAINAGVAEWENYGGDIFGNGIVDTNALYDDSTVDGKNVAAFGIYPDPNVIAITNVWGYFYGPPKTRQLVEWDILFNTYFAWGDATKDTSLMDLQNIATHELGHSAGMDDLYNTSCSLETMYGYSSEGEIIKRDLYKGDIAGIQALY